MNEPLVSEGLALLKIATEVGAAKRILGEMVNLQKVNLPKSQPEHKITKMPWLVFLAS